MKASTTWIRIPRRYRRQSQPGQVQSEKSGLISRSESPLARTPLFRMPGTGRYREQQGITDAVAPGRPHLANPGLITRLRTDGPYNTADSPGASFPTGHGEVVVLRGAPTTEAEGQDGAVARPRTGPREGRAALVDAGSSQGARGRLLNLVGPHAASEGGPRQQPGGRVPQAGPEPGPPRSARRRLSRCRPRRCQSGAPHHEGRCDGVGSG